MIEITDWSTIAEALEERCVRNPWCSMATTDRQGRLRSRVVHPLWEDGIGYVLTSPDSLKAKHLARSPWVTLGYVTPRPPTDVETTYVDCKADWITEPGEQRRIWELAKSLPEPYGYDPAIIWPSGPDAPGVGVLRLRPWRLELSSLAELPTGQYRVWRGTPSVT